MYDVFPEFKKGINAEDTTIIISRGFLYTPCVFVIIGIHPLGVLLHV